MNVNALQAPILQSDLAVPLQDIAREFSKGWSHLPARESPLPALLIADPSWAFIGVNDVKSIFNAEVIYLIDIREKCRSCEDILRVLNLLFEEAKAKNVPLILKLGNFFIPDTGTIQLSLIQKQFLPYAVLFKDASTVTEEEYELVLDDHWTKKNGVQWIIAALFKEKLECKNNLTPLEMIAARTALFYLLKGSPPVLMSEVPKGLNSLLPKMEQGALSHLQQIVPGLYQKLLQNYPTEQSQRELMRGCLMECISSLPGRLSFPYPANIDQIEEEWNTLLRERDCLEALYEWRTCKVKEELKITISWAPYDDNRVFITGEEDYLQASAVNPGRVSFIASSAPTNEKELHYARRLMAREEIGLIVTLVNEMEHICHSTLIEDDSTHWESASKPEKEEPYQLRELTYEYEGKKGRVMQLQHPSWRDGKTTPESHLHAGILLAEKHRKKERPIFIHCKAGLGRTGVFCAAYEIYLQFQEYLAQGNSKEAFKPDIFSIVFRLNLQRHKMVLNEKQYKSLYDYAHFLQSF